VVAVDTLLELAAAVAAVGMEVEEQQILVEVAADLGEGQQLQAAPA
jgi:hypothetical protein